MDFLPLQSLLAHAIQVLLLAALGTAIAFLVRVDSAAVRYAYWRLLLAACLFAPWLQMWRATAAAEPTSGGAFATTATLIGIASAASWQAPALAPRVDWTAVITAILLAGAAARLLWMGAGLVSLGRLRTLGVSADDDAEVESLQELLSTRAEVRFVSGLRQPATFGFRRPVVLLPESLREEDPAIRRALVCHELFHVRRRDWCWVVAEEILLAAFWFNPAVWWLVARVRLAREESVDELTVLATGSRRTYVKALLAFAAGAPLAPAPAFAHRRHLVRRITLLAREAVMSSSRIVLSCAVMAFAVITGSWHAAAAFPITTDAGVQSAQNQPGPLELRSKPVTADNPVPKRTDYQAPEYPAEARALGASGVINFRVTLDDVGRVAEVRRTSFSLTSADLGVSFSLANSSPEGFEAFANRALLRGKDGQVADNRALLRTADAMADAAVAAMRNWRYEPPVNGPLSFDVRVHFNTDGETSAVQNRGVVGVPVASTISTEGAVRVGGNIKAPIKIKDVRPEYPAVAQQARVSGVVIVEARVGVDGSVETVQVLRSIPLLDEAAITAVRQWKFTPTLLNGAPVSVIMTMTVNFTLQ